MSGEGGGGEARLEGREVGNEEEGMRGRGWQPP